jgi:hypothetical protein
MGRHAKYPDYAEIWLNANRARDVHLALLFALARAAFKGWHFLRQPARRQSESLPPADVAAGDAGRQTPHAFREADVFRETKAASPARVTPKPASLEREPA